MSSRTSRHSQRMRRRPRGLIPVVSVIAALTLLAGAFAGVKLLSGWGQAPAASGGKSVAVQVVRGHQAKVPVMNPWHGKPVSWPAPGAGSAVITTAVTVPSRASRLRAGPSAGSGRRAAGMGGAAGHRVVRLAAPNRDGRISVVIPGDTSDGRDGLACDRVGAGGPRNRLHGVPRGWPGRARPGSREPGLLGLRWRLRR